jgi:hypothetical protein
MDCIAETHAHNPFPWARLATLPPFGHLAQAKAASVWQRCQAAVQERMLRQSGMVRVLEGVDVGLRFSPAADNGRTRWAIMSGGMRHRVRVVKEKLP